MIDFFLTRDVANVVSFWAECIIIVWFFGELENHPNEKRQWLGCLFLLGIGYLYFTPENQRDLFTIHSLESFAVQLWRILLYWLAVAGYLLTAKEIRKSSAAYAAGFLSVIYLTVQNIRINIMLLIRLAEIGKAYERVSTYVAILVEVILVILIRRWVRLPRLKAAGGIRWGFLSIAALLGLYFKWSLLTMMAVLIEEDYWDNMLIFAFCASLAVLAVLVFFEVSQQAQEKRREAELEQISLNYEMQNAKRALQTNNDIRRLYHDMKNHLLAIQSMAGEREELRAYLGELLPRFEGYEGQVFTGSPTVDALLSEKIQRAALDDIRFNICLNLSKLSFVKSVDLITIFGNAVDNAIEAVQMLPAGVERIIYLKSFRFANLTVLRCSNQFRGERVSVDGSLPTRKANPDMHGIGLNSIREATGRYGGNTEPKADNERGWFDLTVMIPDPDK